MDNQINMEGQTVNQSSQQNQDNYKVEESQPKITVNDAGISHIVNIAKWTKFLAIVSTVAIALCVIIFLALSTQMREMAFIGIFYIVVIVAIYFYPIKKAFSMASHMKNSAMLIDSEEFEKGLADLKGILQFLGILTIVMLVLYVIAFIFGISGMFFARSAFMG